MKVGFAIARLELRPLAGFATRFRSRVNTSISICKIICKCAIQILLLIYKTNAVGVSYEINH